MKAIIKTLTSEYEVDFFSPTLVSDLIKKSGADFDFPCSENGKCGKCKVQITGYVTEPSNDEKNLLSFTEIQNNIRLACCTFAKNNVFINCNTELTYFQDNDNKISTHSPYEKCFLILDIGTTSLEAKIIDKSRNTVDKILQKNPQTIFGADVISRIDYANKNGVEHLKKKIVDFIEDIKSKYNIEYSVITGNTAMLHFLNGLSTEKMAVYPFECESLFGYENDNVYYPHCVSAFVGADIVCAAVYSDLMKYNNALLIDIGTNGEMMYIHNGEIKCCSAPAGPVFEGYGIKNGSYSRKGAVNKVYLDDGKVRYNVIGDANATSICGSGIIDAVSILLEMGIIDESGYMENTYRLPDCDVKIYPEDIRNIQMAKSAIRSGIDILCEDYSSLEKVFISGNFGSFLNIDNCIKIGMIPEDFKDKVEIIGNGALKGAEMMLDQSNRLNGKKISSICKSIDLANTTDFSQKYIEYMSF